MIESDLKTALDTTGILCIDFKGTSMLPLLVTGRDKVEIRKFDKLRKMDVILYVRKDGTQILHRIYKILKSGYVLCGDNHFILEYGVQEKNIIGVATGFYKKDKYVNFKKSIKYKLYVLIYCRCLFIRKIIRKTYSLFKRIFCRKKV